MPGFNPSDKPRMKRFVTKIIIQLQAIQAVQLYFDQWINPFSRISKRYFISTYHSTHHIGRTDDTSSSNQIRFARDSEIGK